MKRSEIIRSSAPVIKNARFGMRFLYPVKQLWSYWLLVTRDSLLVPPFAKATGDKTHPPSREARHPPPEAVGIHMTDATNCYDSFHSLAVGIGMFPSRD